MEVANPLLNLSPGELAMRYPQFYPPEPSVPQSSYVPSSAPSGLEAASPNQLAKAFPQFYPDGPGVKVPNLPAANIPDPIQTMSGPELAQRFPGLYPDAPKMPGLPANFGDAPILPQMPVEAPAGFSPGTFLRTPIGGGVLSGALAGAVGLATGAPLETAAGEALGAGLGTVLGGGAGSIFGPVGTFVGANLGGTLGALLGGQLGQSIHNLFHPPPSTYKPITGPRDPFPPLTGSRYTLYRVTAIGKFKNQQASHFENVVIGPVGGVGHYERDGIQTYTLISNGGSSVEGYMSGAESTIDQPVVITNVVAVDGSKDPLTAPPIRAYPPNQTDPNPRGIPFGVDFGDPDPRPQLPPTLPQTAPVPRIGPQTEPSSSPATGAPVMPPEYRPSPTGPKPGEDDPSKPSGSPSSSPLPNMNNLPGLFGLPFIPAVMPSNRPSPSGSLDLDPGNGPTGRGKPPQAPTNSPCSGACQRAIEGRIQGVDDKLSKALQGANTAGQDAALAAILARLAVIDAKLGAQAAGGLSGFLARFRETFDKVAKWLQLDRALAIMTFAATFHNAYMLSNQLSQTLFSMISNVLAAVGLKDHEGNPYQIGSVIEKGIEGIAKSMLGATTVDGIKAEWKKYNRIYQAAANILWSVQSISNSILSALEVVGSYVGKIGNALKKWRVVGEKAYSWMNPQPNFQNRFFTAIESTQNVISQVDQVASEVLNIETTVANIGTQATDIQKALKEDTGTKPGTPTPEAAKVAAAAAASSQHSVTPPIPIATQSKPEG